MELIKVALDLFEVSYVGLSRDEMGQVVLGLVELKMYQDGMS